MHVYHFHICLNNRKVPLWQFLLSSIRSLWRILTFHSLGMHPWGSLEIVDIKHMWTDPTKPLLDCHYTSCSHHLDPATPLPLEFGEASLWLQTTYILTLYNYKRQIKYHMWLRKLYDDSTYL